MMKVIIFGDQDTAQLAHYYLTHDSCYEVQCFTVHSQYMTKSEFCGLPVIPFEEIVKNYSPEEYAFFAPIYAKDMNRLREKICQEIKSYGYDLISYISSKANTWNSSIGDNCFILEGCNIQPFSRIGDNVIIWSYSHVGHHSAIDSNVFISGHVVIAGHNKIGQYSFMGTNCSTRDSTIIPEGTFIGQDASVVSKIDEPWHVWVGVPAKKLKSSEGVI